MKKRCPVCEVCNAWKNVDHLRVKKVGMIMCESCGFVTYDSAFRTAEEVKEYYRKNYRPAPQAGNLFTGERKLQYHTQFLTPLFEEWKKAGINSPVVGEIGSAMGMLLNWIKQTIPNADIHGTELTESFRRVAYHEYGIKLAEEFDASKKYDLIISYHVLEHQPEPDLRLKEYAACLKDSGVFYLSVPVWFKEASNGASGPGFDIDQYWHEDHLNSWSEQHLEHIIAKAGLKIILKNDVTYGQTYLLQKTDSAAPKVSFDFKEYLEKAKRLFECWELIQEHKTALAIEAWRNCPCAWIHHYEYNRAAFHKTKDEFNKFFESAIEACPNSADILTFSGDVYTRYERYEEAIKLFNRSLERKTNSPATLVSLSNCFRMLAKTEKDEQKKIELYKQSINICRFVMATSTEMLPQALSWCYQDQAEVPVPL